MMKRLKEWLRPAVYLGQQPDLPGGRDPDDEHRDHC